MHTHSFAVYMSKSQNARTQLTHKTDQPRNRVPKRTIMVRTGDKPWFDDQCILAHCAKQREYRVWSRSRRRMDWEDNRVSRHHGQHVHVEAERAFNEQSRALITIAQNPRIWWSTVKTAVFGASSSLPPLVDRRYRLVCSADEKGSLFSALFDASNAKTVFSSRIPVTLLSCCVLLPSGLALFTVWFWVGILKVEMIPMVCFHSFASRWLLRWRLTWL